MYLVNHAVDLCILASRLAPGFLPFRLRGASEPRHRRFGLPLAEASALPAARLGLVDESVAESLANEIRQICVCPPPATGAKAVERVAIVEQATKRAEINVLHDLCMVAGQHCGVRPGHESPQ